MPFGSAIVEKSSPDAEDAVEFREGDDSNVNHEDVPANDQQFRDEVDIKNKYSIIKRELEHEKLVGGGDLPVDKEILNRAAQSLDSDQIKGIFCWRMTSLLSLASLMNCIAKGTTCIIFSKNRETKKRPRSEQRMNNSPPNPMIQVLMRPLPLIRYPQAPILLERTIMLIFLRPMRLDLINL